MTDSGDTLDNLAGPESLVWANSLPPEKKAALLRIRRKNLGWSLAPMIFPLLWFAAAGLMGAFPTWPVRAAGTIAIAFSIHGCWNLMHKGVHGNITYKPGIDRVISFLVGLPALFSASAYRTIHLEHHKYNRQERDPQELSNLAKDPRILSFFFYTLMLTGTFLAVILIPVSALRMADSSQRRSILAEIVLMVLIYAGIFSAALYLDRFTDLLRWWLVPLLAASFFGNLRAWAEHGLLPKGHPLTQTRTVTSSGLVSLLFLNANYHLEHHLFPGMPWYRLPEVHRMLLEDYQAAGSSIYRSYIKFLWDAARIGVHGHTPKQKLVQEK